MSKIDTEVDLDRELAKYDKLLDDLWDDLGKEGVALPDQPAIMPQWPASIMRLSDREMWEIHADFQEFFRYISGREAYSKAYLGICKEKTALVRAAIRKRSNGPNKEVREDVTTLDSLYQQTRQEEVYWDTLHGLHTRLREIFDDDVKALSRQLNRVDTDNKNIGRSVNVGNMRGGRYHR